MQVRQRLGRGAGRPLIAVGEAALVARAVVGRGGVVRLASLALHRLRQGSRPPREPEESRLYAHGRERLEAHLARRRDGRRVVLAMPVGGPARSTIYTVDERRPWHDFERQAGLRHAAWGPCRDVSAGL